MRSETITIDDVTFEVTEKSYEAEILSYGLMQRLALALTNAELSTLPETLQGVLALYANFAAQVKIIGGETTLVIPSLFAPIEDHVTLYTALYRDPANKRLISAVNAAVGRVNADPVETGETVPLA